MNRDIVKPLFIVGCSRSGTSLLYRRLAMHADLAFFYKWSRKFPTSAWLSRLARLVVRDPQPKEAGAIWRRHAKAVRRDDDSLCAGDVTPAARRYFHDVLRTQLSLFDKPRFLSKHPRNGLRMDYFREIFPDAVFIHIIRDGRAVANSIYVRREDEGDVHAYWDIKPPGWRDLLSLDPIVSCGGQWEKTVRYIRRAGQALPKGQYVEVRYEDFTRKPRETLIDLAQACNLPAWPAALLDEAVRDVRPPGEGWRKKLTAEQVTNLEAAIGPYLKEIGYTASA